jgi:acetyltransferase-like isoleucine patch superfamily enzyme
MKSVSIGDGCWLGANSIVLPGVYLANNTTVAAGALVTKSVYTENTTIVGVPARKIKD